MQIKCLDSEGMQNELVFSRQLIEDQLGKTVNAFSFGRCNATAIKEVFESGYEFCCTSRHGIFSPEERTIPRNSINGSMSVNEISRVLNASHGIRARWLLEDTLKSILKLTLKTESYKKIRTLFVR